MLGRRSYCLWSLSGKWEPHPILKRIAAEPRLPELSRVEELWQASPVLPGAISEKLESCRQLYKTLEDAGVPTPFSKEVIYCRGFLYQQQGRFKHESELDLPRPILDIARIQLGESTATNTLPAGTYGEVMALLIDTPPPTQVNKALSLMKEAKLDKWRTANCIARAGVAMHSAQEPVSSEGLFRKAISLYKGVLIDTGYSSTVFLDYAYAVHRYCDMLCEMEFNQRSRKPEAESILKDLEDLARTQLGPLLEVNPKLELRISSMEIEARMDEV